MEPRRIQNERHSRRSKESTVKERVLELQRNDILTLSRASKRYIHIPAARHHHRTIGTIQRQAPQSLQRPSGTMKVLTLLLLLSSLLNTVFSFSSCLIVTGRPSLGTTRVNQGASPRCKSQSRISQRQQHPPVLWLNTNGVNQDESFREESFYIRKALYAGKHVVS